MSQNSENGTRPLTCKMHFEIILAPGESSQAIKQLPYILKKGRFPYKYIVSLTQIKRIMYEYNILVCQVSSEPLGEPEPDRAWGKCIAHQHSLKTNISIRKMHWLAQGLRKVKFRWDQVSLWQHRVFKRNLFLNLYGEGEKKNNTSLFLPDA